MKIPALLMVTTLTVGLIGCGGDEAAEDEGAATPAAAEPAQMEPAPAQAPAQEAAPAQTQAPPPMSRPSMPRVDEPYDPVFSGTVAPGMSRDDVVNVWGEPVAERMAGSRMYLYYRNGCEASCGTFDVVFLDNGAVVDAIVRGPGHEYAGASSSPAGREGAFTAPIP
jgi:hypothetical protein